MWIETTSSSLTFAQLGLDVTRGFCFYAEGHLMWFSSVWPFFPECIKTSFFLFFLLPQVDYKSYLLDFKSLPLKDEADEDGNGSGGVTEDSGTTLTNFFFFSFFSTSFMRRRTHSFFFSFQVLELRKKRLKLKTKCLADTTQWSFLKCVRLSLHN